MQAASWVKVKEEQAFAIEESIWPAKVELTEREALWHRRELSACMRGILPSSLPSTCKGFTITIDQETILRRGSSSASIASDLRQRPNLYNFIVSGQRMHVINFATKEHTLRLKEHGIGGVPCGNPHCSGKGGAWNTSPLRWSCKTAGAAILVGESGMPEPMICCISKCDDCGQPFSHTNPVTLRRLVDVPELLDLLPFDPEYSFTDIFLGRSHTSNLEYDEIKRQGVKNLVEKITKLGAEWVQRRVKAYYASGKIWLTQLAQIVGDGAWEGLSRHNQLELANLRGEFLFFTNTPNALTPLGPSNGRYEQRRFNVPRLSAGVLTSKLLSAWENRRSLNESHVCAVGASKVISLDWCHAGGKALGGKLLANLVNEDGTLMATATTRSEAIEELLPTLTEINDRPNVTARVAVIDKVPTNLSEDKLSKLEVLFMQSIGTIERVMQDKFHVTHNVSKDFNNMDARYYQLVIHGFRQATHFLGKEEDLIDEALMAGLVQKGRKNRQIRYGERFTRAEIQAMKDSGWYHDFFSASDVVVPEHVKSAAALELGLERWEQNILDACFHPPDEQGRRIPILVNGQRLVASVEILHKIASNALKRMKKCIPPSDMDAWEPTDRADQNGFTIFKPLFHTCGCESLNALQTSYTNSNESACLATGCFLEGNTKQIMQKLVALGQQEDLGTWDIRSALQINKLAGFDGSDTAFSLVDSRPLLVEAPPPKPASAIILHNIGRLDAKAGMIPTEAELSAQRDAPQVSCSLPPALLLQHPYLKRTAEESLRGLAERRRTASEDEELDVAQLDSPTSRARLQAGGIDDPTKASPSSLKRAWEATKSYVRGLFIDETPSSTSVLEEEVEMLPPPSKRPARSSLPAQSSLPTAEAPTPTQSSLPTAEAPTPTQEVPMQEAKCASLPLVLGQAKSKGAQSAADAQKAAKQKMHANRWCCTCLAEPEKRGKKNHQADCKREVFERNGQEPKIGDVVVCLQSAGPRAGFAYRCVAMDRHLGKGWVRVPELDQLSATEMLSLQ